MLLESPRHYRAIKARAVRYGDTATAEAADVKLRAHRIAVAIKAGCSGPPLPPDVIDELRNLLPPAGR